MWWRRSNSASSTSGGWRNVALSPTTLTNVYRCTIESILPGYNTAWYSNCTAHNCRDLQRVVRSAQHSTGGKLPTLQDICCTRCHKKAKKMIKDNNHPSHCHPATIQKARSVQVHQSWDRKTEKYLLSQGHQTVIKQPLLTQWGCCLHTDLKSLATLINGSQVTLIMPLQ